MTAIDLLRALSAALDIVESDYERRRLIADLVIEWDSRGRRGIPGDGKWFCACEPPYSSECAISEDRCSECGLGRPK